MPSKPGQGRGKPRPRKARKKALALTPKQAKAKAKRRAKAADPELAEAIEEIVEDLPLRKQKFIEHYLVLGVASIAAEKAGYAKTTAKSAWRLLRDPEIAAVIELRKREMLAEVGLTPRRALLELKAMATSSVDNYRVGQDGNIALKAGVDPMAIGALSSVKITRTRRRRGRPPTDPAKDDVLTDETIDLKLWDKGRALDRALELLGLLGRLDKPYNGAQQPNAPRPSEDDLRGVGVRVTVTGGPTGVEAQVEALSKG